MKQYDLDIIAADKTVRFSVMEPETKEEKSVGLSFLDSLPGAEELRPMGEVIVHQLGQRLDKFKVDYFSDDKVEEFVKQLNQGKGGIDAEKERAASEPSDAEN